MHAFRSDNEIKVGSLPLTRFSSVVLSTSAVCSLSMFLLQSPVQLSNCERRLMHPQVLNKLEREHRRKDHELLLEHHRNLLLIRRRT
jgi:hypothetical protein